MYVLAFPIMTLLAVMGVNGLGLPSFVAASMCIVLPAAFLSWRLVERPALELRYRSRKRGVQKVGDELVPGHVRVDKVDL